jgi:hypothetical protein
MRKRNQYKWPLAIGLILLATGLKAQGVFRWRATLDTIRRDGFYQVLIGPEIVAKCNGVRLADLRILGPGGRFVSYVLKDSRRGDDANRQWLPLPHGVLTQKDSANKHSYIELHFDEAYEVDQLSLRVRDPVFFKRDAQIFAEGGTPGDWDLVTDISLEPSITRFRIPPVMTHRLRIEIANADNAPLLIRDITAFQSARFLLTYLTTGTSYQLLTGNKQAVPPEYDLKYFTDSLSVVPATLVAGPMQQTTFANGPAPLPAGKRSTAEHSGGVLLWGILFAILILLVFFSARLISAITKKERNDRI